uniref:hypothetical protein n=1 Tax=Ningiella ruwaisensis TaxID=2364274 RepID=UPI0010A08425|nr:hypothetical protein [Ningiella ruwaisensis]
MSMNTSSTARSSVYAPLQNQTERRVSSSRPAARQARPNRQTRRRIGTSVRPTNTSVVSNASSSTVSNGSSSAVLNASSSAVSTVSSSSTSRDRTQVQIPSLSLSGNSANKLNQALQCTPSVLASSSHALKQSVQSSLNQEHADHTRQPVVVSTKIGDSTGSVSNNTANSASRSTALTDVSATLSSNASQGLSQASDVPEQAQQNNGLSQSTAQSTNQETAHETSLAESQVRQAQQDLQLQSQTGGFFDWLLDNFAALVNQLPSRDESIQTSAGPAPELDTTGRANPELLSQNQSEAHSQIAHANLSLQRAMASADKNENGQSPIQAPEQTIQQEALPQATPLSLQETNLHLNNAQQYAATALPANVREGADLIIAQSMQAQIEQGQTQLNEAEHEQTLRQQQAQQEANTRTQAISEQSNQAQHDAIVSHRESISQEQANSISQANLAQSEFTDSAQREASDNHHAIVQRVNNSNRDASSTLQHAEHQAEVQRSAGEREAAGVKESLNREQENDSWWDRATDAIKQAFERAAQRINAIFTRIRRAVATIIERAKNAAINLINRARQFVIEKLNQFRVWAQQQITALLSQRFPRLAAILNTAIDRIVGIAMRVINRIADAAVALVRAVAGFLGRALDFILHAFQTALAGVFSILAALVSGNFLEALKIAIRVACEIAGVDPQPIFDFFTRAGENIMRILRDPMTFFQNLIEAVRGGIAGFADNIRTHLINGLLGWLTGALSDIPINFPERLDFKGIISLIAQILGLTFENVKARIIRRFPPAERVFDAIERGMEVIQLIRREGIAGIWEMIKAQLANLKEMVLEGIRNFVVTRIVTAGITWLLSLLNPAAAIVRMVKMLYDLVMFFVERFSQIRDFVSSVYNSMVNIAIGAITPAKTAIEQAMARSLPVIISFLASLIGLGGISGAIRRLIQRMTRPINRVIDRIVNRVIRFARRLIRRVRRTVRRGINRARNWWNVRKSFAAPQGEQHTLFLKGRGSRSVLTMRSVEQPYARFLSNINEQNLSTANKRHLRQARSIQSQIVAKIREPIAGNAQQRSQKEQVKQRELDSLFTNLSTHTQHLFTRSIPNYGEVTYSGMTGANYSKGMKISVLTKQNNPRGSGPTRSAHTQYDIIDRRRSSKTSTATFYIRGHLLNEHLGGPGQWKNMTPLSRSGNAQHETQVESYVKAGFDSGEIQSYEVIPSYSARSGKSNLKALLQSLHPTNHADFEAVVDAEDNVPSHLAITAKRFTQDAAGNLREERSRSWRIDNDINQDANHYALSGSPRIYPVDINSLTHSRPLVALNHLEITPQALPIFRAVRERKRNNQAMFGRYSTLSNEANQHGGSTSTAMLERWNNDGYILLRH